MTRKMLIDLDRCVGCWTCSMACKVGNHLDDEDYRITVTTHGSGAGIDRPAGVYPKLNMSWQPIYHDSCTFCPDRLTEGEVPFCANCCPTRALAFGEEGDADSAFARELARVERNGYRLFVDEETPDARANVIYATRRS